MRTTHAQSRRSPHPSPGHPDICNSITFPGSLPSALLPQLPDNVCKGFGIDAVLDERNAEGELGTVKVCILGTERGQLPVQTAHVRRWQAPGYTGAVWGAHLSSYEEDGDFVEYVNHFSGCLALVAVGGRHYA